MRRMPGVGVLTLVQCPPYHYTKQLNTIVTIIKWQKMTYTEIRKSMKNLKTT